MEKMSILVESNYSSIRRTILQPVAKATAASVTAPSSWLRAIVGQILPI